MSWNGRTSDPRGGERLTNVLRVPARLKEPARGRMSEHVGVVGAVRRRGELICQDVDERLGEAGPTLGRNERRQTTVGNRFMAPTRYRALRHLEKARHLSQPHEVCPRSGHTAPIGVGCGHHPEGVEGLVRLVVVSDRALDHPLGDPENLERVNTIPLGEQVG
jgi:hypothetical protein